MGAAADCHARERVRGLMVCRCAGYKIETAEGVFRVREGIRRNPQMTSLLVNPENPYHWVQIKQTVEKELCDWEPGGEYVTQQLDRGRRALLQLLGRSARQDPPARDVRPVAVRRSSRKGWRKEGK
jgi:hypothetical protein